MSIESLNNTLSTQSFYVLLAVADRPLHGYGIREQIISDTSGAVIVPAGTLYPAIKRLTKERLLEQIDAIDTDPRIKYRYRITEMGARLLKEEAIRVSRLSLHARYKLGEQILRR